MNLWDSFRTMKHPNRHLNCTTHCRPLRNKKHEIHPIRHSILYHTSECLCTNPPPGFDVGLLELLTTLMMRFPKQKEALRIRYRIECVQFLGWSFDCLTQFSHFVDSSDSLRRLSFSLVCKVNRRRGLISLISAHAEENERTKGKQGKWLGSWGLAFSKGGGGGV